MACRSVWTGGPECEIAETWEGESGEDRRGKKIRDINRSAVDREECEYIYVVLLKKGFEDLEEC